LTAISAVSQARSHPYIVKPKVSQKRKKVSEVALQYLKTTSGVKQIILKPISLSLKTAKWWNSGLSERGQTASRIVKDTQTILDISSLPSSMNSFMNDMGHLKAAVKKRSYKDVAKATAKVGISGAGLSLSFTSLVEAGCRASFYSLSSRSVTFLKRMGVVGQAILIGSNINDIATHVDRIKEVRKISTNGELKKDPDFAIKAREKILFSTVKIGEKITVISLMGLALATFLAGFSVAAWIFIALSSLGLMISIGTYFYEQIYSPYGEKAPGSMDL
jgi:hypothetical protein